MALRGEEEIEFNGPKIRSDALRFFDDLVEKGLDARFFLNRTGEGGNAVLQIQIRVECAEDDLLFVAQQARQHQYAVDAEQSALLINVTSRSA